MDFPIAELMDEDACYAKLLHWLHPDGLACPRCGARDGLGVHRRHRAPILDYRCKACRRVFNAFTGTALQGTQRPARRADADPPRLRPGRPHRPTGPRAGLRPQGVARAAPPAPARRLAVPGPVPAGRPGGRGRRDVPERGGKKACRTPTRSTRRGGGRTRPAATAAWDSDRPPVCGVVGRDSGRLRLSVERHADAGTLKGRPSPEGVSKSPVGRPHRSPTAEIWIIAGSWCHFRQLRNSLVKSQPVPADQQESSRSHRLFDYLLRTLMKET